MQGAHAFSKNTRGELHPVQPCLEVGAGSAASPHFVIYTWVHRGKIKMGRCRYEFSVFSSYIRCYARQYFCNLFFLSDFSNVSGVVLLDTFLTTSL